MGNSARIVDQSTNMVGAINQWTWLLDGVVAANSQQPVLIASTPGTHTVKLVVKTTVGCESDTVTRTFVANPAPVINVTASDGCVDQPINFFANQTDNLTTIHNGIGILEMEPHHNCKTLCIVIHRRKYECADHCNGK